jgi:NAD(P)-dependent dehydrogenase (short-subunit alcohol dehydrogenase family)
MNNILITGANRGLELGFVKHYLNRGDRVWATYRIEAGSLSELNSSACIPVKWDVTEPLADAEQAKLPDKVHLLINNAVLVILHFNKPPK